MVLQDHKNYETLAPYFRNGGLFTSEGDASKKVIFHWMIICKVFHSCWCALSEVGVNIFKPINLDHQVLAVYS